MLELLTGCRLHFGLLELAADQPNRYGGLGLMLESPRLRLRLHRAQSEATSSPLSAPSVEVHRRIQLAQSHAESMVLQSLTRPSSSTPASGWIELVECPPMHSGLGVGTQLDMAVARLTELGLTASSGYSADASQPVTADRGASALEAVSHLAQLSGRGKRSAIGMHGFVAGGLIRDLGYAQAAVDTSSPTNVRPIQTTSCSVPAAWRVVLWTSRTSGDMHGETEDRLIDRAAACINTNRNEMLDLSQQCMVATQADNFAEFVGALDRYMLLAAQMFSTVQAGQYRDQRTADRVDQMRAVGLAGVGQSSWGPTVFGFAHSIEQARAAIVQLTPHVDEQRESLILSKPLNHGAQWSMSTSEGVQHAG